MTVHPDNPYRKDFALATPARLARRVMSAVVVFWSCLIPISTEAAVETDRSTADGNYAGDMGVGTRHAAAGQSNQWSTSQVVPWENRSPESWPLNYRLDSAVGDDWAFEKQIRSWDRPAIVGLGNDLLPPRTLQTLKVCLEI